MLVELRIRGYAVIEDLALTLGSGLSVLSGETGAGKSIVVDALSLLLGERASSDVVRAGEARAVVEAVFDLAGQPELSARLDHLGLPVEEGLLILRREVQAEGRNRAWVNGSPATAALVGELGASLVDLHGQHEHQTLLRPEQQRQILDDFAGARELAGEVTARHQDLARLGEDLARRETRRRELEARADFLRFQLGEIDSARAEPGEEEALDEEARRLEHARELGEGASRAHEALYAGEGALSDRLAELRSLLERLAGYDAALAEPAALLQEAFHQVVEVGRRMGDYAAGAEQDPGRLEAIRKRQDLLFRLKRKYGPGLADVLESGQRLRAELAELDGAAHDLGALRGRIEGERGELVVLAGKLTRKRSRAAARLAREVEETLPALGMPEGSFVVRLEPLAALGPGGAESVQFLVSLNPGFEPRPLSRIASGGELSRVMLALKSILAEVDRIPTLIFDEIDAGVGGVVAGSVAEKLRAVADHRQVLVITHLAQLASRAHAHLRVEKSLEGGLARTRITTLQGEERIREIARMLGGDPDSQKSREHARELLRVG
jgi:DNA repair protein RecN (Recombination protein N)